MNILYQIAIIFSLCLAGELISAILPIFIPSAIISLILLFIMLESKILKIDHIKEKSDFLLANMAFFFIPAGVKVIDYFSIIKSIWWQFILVCLTSTILVFFITGSVVKLTLRLMRGKTNA